MQPHEAFKLGFLARCVEEGFSPEQTNAMAKKAEDLMTKVGFLDFIQNPIKATTDTGKSLVDLTYSSLPLIAGAAAIPPALGGLSAYLVNKATDVGDKEIEEYKQRELIDTYQRMAKQLNRQKELQNYKQNRKRTGRIFM